MIDDPRRPGLDPGQSFFFHLAQGSLAPEQVRGDGGRLASVVRVMGAASLALVLAACGKAAGLAPPEGHQLPIAPIGAKATPSPTQLLTPTTQQRPQRGDELLKSSDERRSDEFDIPPQ